MTAHIEPFDIRLRKGSRVDEDKIRKIIQDATKKHRQAFRIKRIITYVADKKEA